MTSQNTSVPSTLMGSTLTTLLSSDEFESSTTISSSSTSSSEVTTTTLVSSDDSSSVLVVSPSSSNLEGITSSVTTTKSTDVSGEDSQTFTYNTLGLSSNTTANTTILIASHHTGSSTDITSSSTLISSHISTVSSSSFSSSESSSSSSSSSSSESSSEFSSPSSLSSSASSSPSSSVLLTSSTSASSSLPTTSFVSSTVDYLTSETSALPESTTIYYTQPYYITDASTTLTTNLPLTTVVDASSSFTPTTSVTLTSDFAFLAEVVPNYKAAISSSSNKGTIAGSVVGSVAGVGIILFLAWFFLYKRRKRLLNENEKGFSHSISTTRRYDEDYTHEKPLDQDRELHTSNNGNNSTGLSSLIPSLPRISSSSGSTENSSSSTISSSSTNGLSSLRTSILKDQEIPNDTVPLTHPYQKKAVSAPPLPTSRPSRYTNRTIDTVFEDSESDLSSAAPIKSPYMKKYKANSARYKNAGLKPIIDANPFEDSSNPSSKRSAPPPPPSRRAVNSSASSSSTPATGSVMNQQGTVGGPEEFHRGHGNNRYSVTSVESSILSDEIDDISTDDSLIQLENEGRDGHHTGFFREIV